MRDMQLDAEGTQLLVAGTQWLNILHVRTRCMLTPHSALSAQVGSGNTAVSLTLPSQAWSCCWDATDLNVVHAGLQQGSLLSFDIRHPAMPLATNTQPPGVPPTPLHTLVAGPYGVLSATYTAVVAWGGHSGGQGSQGPTSWQVQSMPVVL